MDPEDIGVLRDRGYGLVLTTCTPPYSAEHRLIVWAKLERARAASRGARPLTARLAVAAAVSARRAPPGTAGAPRRCRRAASPAALRLPRRPDTGRHEEEPLGAGHGAQDARPLRAGGREAQDATLVSESAAARLGPALGALHRLRRRGGEPGPIDVRPALQRQDRRPHVHLEADHGGDGVPGDAEHQGVVPRPEGERLSRLGRDAPEPALDAEFILHLLDEVVVADRDPARRDHHVVLQRRREQAARLVGIVAGDAQQDRVRAGSHDLAVGGEGVGVANLPRGERPASRHELAARGEYGDARTAGHAHALEAHRGEQPDLGRAEARAALEEDVAGAHVLARAAHVRPCWRGGLDGDEVVVHRRVLDLHDRVGARRQRRPGHDARGRTGRDRLLHVPSGGDVDDHPEIATSGLELRSRHGEAVHR